jgi:hypothetical protein
MDRTCSKIAVSIASGQHQLRGLRGILSEFCYVKNVPVAL